MRKSRSVELAITSAGSGSDSTPRRL